MGSTTVFSNVVLAYCYIGAAGFRALVALQGGETTQSSSTIWRVWDITLALGKASCAQPSMDLKSSLAWQSVQQSQVPIQCVLCVAAAMLAAEHKLSATHLQGD